MKSAGFPAHLAAAIEAVASNGGQITPPVMGAAAFLMAEFLNIPYGQIALAASIPAALYYLALFTQIDLESAKRGLLGLPADQIPKFRNVIRLGWVFCSLSILVYTLMIENWEAGKAGMVVIGVLVVGALQKAAVIQKNSHAFEETGKTLLDIAVITALAGIVIGARNRIYVQDIALARHIVRQQHLSPAHDHRPRLLVPRPAAADHRRLHRSPSWPRRRRSTRHSPLAAHLFLFYFGMVSLITPPDCLPVYIAAPWPANFWQTGWCAMRLGIAAYVVPFIFRPASALIFIGTAKKLPSRSSPPPLALSYCRRLRQLFIPSVDVAKRGLLWLAVLLLLPRQAICSCSPTSPASRSVQRLSRGSGATGNEIDSRPSSQTQSGATMMAQQFVNRLRRTVHSLSRECVLSYSSSENALAERSPTACATPAIRYF
jgi:hypothetical protein